MNASWFAVASIYCVFTQHADVKKPPKPKKEKPKKRSAPPDIRTILALAKLGLQALDRFRQRLRVQLRSEGARHDVLAAVLGSAFYLVQLQYESRTVYAAMDKTQAAARKLTTERETLEVQKRAQTAALRVQSIAREQLAMREATPSITQYVTIRNGQVTVSTPVAEAGQIAASGRKP